MADRKTTAEGDRTRTLRQLRELIAALDRRVPHIERLGKLGLVHVDETSIKLTDAGIPVADAVASEFLDLI